jgi:predicted nucleotidyltransferase
LHSTAPIQDPRVAEFLRDYLPRLVAERRPLHVIVFGSRARGDALRDRSDLDLLIVSEAFAGMPFLERAYQVIWTLQTPFPVEVLCYIPAEFGRKKAELGIVRTAYREGYDLLALPPAAPGSARASRGVFPNAILLCHNGAGGLVSHAPTSVLDCPAAGHPGVSGILASHQRHAERHGARSGRLGDP